MKWDHFLFPRICSLCQALLEEETGFFCKSCAVHFALLDPKSRCFYCFGEDERRLCASCRQKKAYSIAWGALWEKIGPIPQFIHKLQREAHPLYIKMLTAFFLVQWPRLSFPKPDIIIPVPDFFFTTLFKGHCINKLVAKNLSQALNIPQKNYLYTFSLEGRSFNLKRETVLTFKKVLLIDVMISQAKEKALETCLLQESPELLLGLTLCPPEQSQ